MNTVRALYLIRALGCAGLVLVASGCRPKSGAALPEKLAGTWHITGIDGHNTGPIGDLTFTFTTNGEYTSQITIPDKHSIKGFATVKDGMLLVTITNRDNAAERSTHEQRETIVHCDGEELVILPEGSDMAIHFRKLERTREGP